MALLIFLVILGILILVHEYGHFLFARRGGVKVENFSIGFGPQLFCSKREGTEYRINAIPLGGYVKMAGDSREDYKGEPNEYFSKAPGVRARIVFAGPLLNYLLGFLLFWLILFVGNPTLTTKVGGLVEGFGAEQAGIREGDRIIAVDGEEVAYWEELLKVIREKEASSLVDLSVVRDERERTIKVRLKEKELDTVFGEKKSVSLIGIIPGDEIVSVKYGFLKSFPLAAGEVVGLTTLTYKALWRMVIGRMSVRESVTGPLGIFFIASKTASLGVVALLKFMAILSISLAIFNLLPLPVLDGGHLVLLAVERIRRRALSLKVERVISQVGITMIVSLALFVTYNDFLKFGDKILKWFTR
ncbi:RIP metalloprotease RseP [Candidatus Omnitrophota bacterium]